MMEKKLVLTVAVVLFGAILLAGGCRRETPLEEPAELAPQSLIGKPLPQFTMTDIDGNTWTNETVAGDVVVVDFWATWCGPCRAASPVLQSFHDAYAEDGLTIIGANVGEVDDDLNLIQTPDRAAQYAEEHGYDYVFTYGAEDFMKTCNVQGFPTILIVDRDGVVRDVVVGFGPGVEQQMEKVIVPLLNGTAHSEEG